MKKHKLTLIETRNLNDLRDGDIYVKFDNSTGLITELAKRKNGKMVSMLYSKSNEEVELVKEEVKEDVTETVPLAEENSIEDIPASEDTLDIKPLKIE